MYQNDPNCFHMSFATLALNRCYFAGSSSAKPSTLKTLECTIFFDGRKTQKRNNAFFRVGKYPQGKEYPCIRWNGINLFFLMDNPKAKAEQSDFLRWENLQFNFHL